MYFVYLLVLVKTFVFIRLLFELAGPVFGFPVRLLTAFGKQTVYLWSLHVATMPM